MMPRLSVIIPWCNRAELEHSLKANLSLMAAWDCEVLIVNYGGDEQLLGSMLEHDNPLLRLIEVRAATFNKSRALNIGLHFARGRDLFLLDADVILHEFDLEQAIGLLDAGAWVTLKKIVESSPASNQNNAANQDEQNTGQIAELANYFEIVLQDQRRVRLETQRNYPANGARSCPGIMLLRRQDLLDIGGFNSALAGWGWEDIDVHARLGLVLQRHRAELGHGTHLSHSDQQRHFIGSSPAQNNLRNQQICLAHYNAGNFDGTLAQDTQAFKLPTNVAPLVDLPLAEQES